MFRAIAVLAPALCSLICMVIWTFGQSAKPALAPSQTLQASNLEYLYRSGLEQVKLGDLSGAYSRFQQVLAAPATADKRLYIYSLNNVAWIYKQYGQTEKASKLYADAIHLIDKESKHATHELRREYVAAKVELFARLADLRYSSGDTTSALELFNNGLAMLRAARDTENSDLVAKLDRFTILENALTTDLGELHASLGNFTEAEARYNAALALSQSLGYDDGSIDVLLALARLSTRRGDTSSTFAHLNAAEALVRKGSRLDQQLKLRSITATIQRQIGRYGAADLSYQETIRISETLRTAVVLPDQRASYFASMLAPFDEYIDFLMARHLQEPDAGFDIKAFNVSERRRARALLDSLKAARADIRFGVDESLLERERRVRAQLNAAALDRFADIDLRFDPDSALVPLPVSGASESDVVLLTGELARIETEIRKQSPRYAELMQPRPLRIGAIQKLLDDDVVLLNYALGEKRSFLWAVTKNKVTSHFLPARSEIEALTKSAHAKLSDGSAEQSKTVLVADTLRSLSKILIEPAVDSIGTRKVVVIADGALQFLPFSSLPDPRSDPAATAPILASNDVQFAPSASVVGVLRDEAKGRAIAPRSIAIFADPVFSRDDDRVGNQDTGPPGISSRSLAAPLQDRLFNPRFLSAAGSSYAIPRLPFSRREADAIFSIVHAGTALRAVDFDANRENALAADLSKFGIVHFATHGILDSEYPELSGIALSMVDQKGGSINGFLRLNEIYNMKLNADLVVLSACQTALGKEVRGEGLIGLTRGFMYAGSPRVLASLWRVDDVATAELMRIFYTKMLKEGAGPAAALRAAKIEMMKQKRWDSPYYWAGFELQGEWR